MFAPLKADISSPFGMRLHPIQGVYKLHNGIDYPVPTGTPVRSPGFGKVSGINYNSSGGNQLFIDHPMGYSTGYAHLSEYKVKEGQYVYPGKIIALSGNTGGSTGPHLHFTVRKDGTPIDPQTVIRDGISPIWIGVALFVLVLFLILRRL